MKEHNLAGVWGTIDKPLGGIGEGSQVLDRTNLGTYRPARVSHGKVLTSEDPLGPAGRRDQTRKDSPGLCISKDLIPIAGPWGRPVENRQPPPTTD
jgi:hypothetical protein